MKRIVCEMCGSTDVIKQNGLYVCQNCETKYSVEEAKKLMIEGTVTVSGPVQVDHSHLVDNYLTMVQNALRADNRSEAEIYCNKIIEVEPTHAKAWLYKGTATAWQSTFAHLRIREAVNCWHTAISNCSEEEIEEFFAYTDDQMNRLTVALCDLSAGFLNGGMNVHKRDSYVQNFKNIVECLRVYTTSIHLKFKWERALNQGAIVAAPHFVKSAEAVKDLYHRIKPTGADSYQEYMNEMGMCFDLAERVAQSVPGAKAKAACYQACVDILTIMDNIGSYHWFDGSTIYRDDLAKQHRFAKDIADFRSKVSIEKAKIPDETQKEYWEDHPEEYKEYQRKQEEERKKKEEERQRKVAQEKANREAFDIFWKTHAAERLAIAKEIEQLTVKKNALLAANTGVEQIKLIDLRCAKLNDILVAKRSGMTNFLSSERDIINEKEAFTAQLESKRGYDAYLDTYPLLKEKDNIKKEKENLESNLRSVTGPGRAWGALLFLGFAVLGGLFIYLGGEWDAGILSLLGGFLAIVGGICFIVYEYQLIKAAFKKSEIKSALAEIARKEKIIAAIPAYTPDFDPKVAKAMQVQQEQKAKRKGKMIIGLVIAGIVVILAFFIVWTTYLAPNQTYNDAMKMLDENRYTEAYALFNEIKSFKDAQEQMNLLLKKNPMLALSVAQNGDIFKFGHYEQDGNDSNGKEDIEWIVLEVCDGKALLVSKYVIDSQPYHSEPRVDNFRSSSLYTWLQNDFFNNAFDSSEKNNILGEISIPSKEQKEQYNINYDPEQTVVAMENGEQYTVYYPETRYYWTWWLEDVYSKKTEAYIGSGSIADIDDKYGVRPIIWVSIEEN